MKLESHTVEFYITNVCNLNCSGCNRFNNLNLIGHEEWDKHRESYKKFSNFVLPKTVNILGGEPLAHPEILKIIQDIRSFWPNHKSIKLITNGLLLNEHKGLGTIIRNCNIKLDINVHNRKFRRRVLSNIEKLFDEKIKLQWLSCKNGIGEATFQISNSNIKHTLLLREYFFQNSLNDPYELSPHESDPDLAWKACYSKCPTLAEGKFFKCPISYCMPTAVKQRSDISLNDKQINLINSFPFILCDNIDQVKKEQWHDFLYKKISQCSLCPESFQTQKIIQKQI